MSSYEPEQELTPEDQRQQDRMLDDMLENYRMRLHVPEYLQDEANRMED